MFPDLIFTLGSLVFIAGLIPLCVDQKAQVPLKTSLPTAIVLFVYTGTFMFMGLEFSMLSSSILTGLWAYIALEKRS